MPISDTVPDVLAMPRAEVHARLIAGIRSGLTGQIIPALSAANDVVTGHLLVRLLDYLEEASLDVEPSLSGRDGLPSDLAGELSALHGRPVDRHDIPAIAEAIATIAPRIDRSAESQPEADFMRRLAAHEVEALTRLDYHGQSGVGATYTKGVVEFGEDTKTTGAPPLTEAGLTQAVRTSARFGPDARAHSIVEIPGGFNKITSTFMVSHNGREEAVVIRRDSVPNPTGFSSVDEFPTLETVWQAGTVPIAEPLMAEPDPAVIGSPFILVQRMPGTTDISDWRKDAGAGRKLAGSLAGALAKLHALDVASFLSAGKAVQPLEEYVRQEIELWRDRSDKWRVRARPAIDAGFAWMLAHIPQVDRKPVFVHGDIGFHNMLMDGGTVTALLDWEFSHVGDPMEDLFYCRHFVEEVCPFKDFVAMYRAAGGARFDPSVGEFYEAWPSLRNGSGADALMKVYLQHPGSDLKFAVAGVQHVRRYENSVLSFLGSRAATASQDR